MPDPAATLDVDVLPPLRDVIARHGLSARRGLGQHFLLDLNITRRIARTAGDLAGTTVLETGPGPGGLTRALLGAGAATVVAVERDRRCVAALAELAELARGRLVVIESDALEQDAAALCRRYGGDGPCFIVSNLPYNVATPLLLKWLGQAEVFAGMTLMFQKEVAERLTAAPRSKAYGRLSVITQWRCHARRDFNLPREAFTPPPKVASTLVTLTPRREPLAEADSACLEAVTAAAFGQRRKMLRSSLKSLGVDSERLLAETGIAGTARAEEIDVVGFCGLARTFARLNPRAAG